MSMYSVASFIFWFGVVFIVYAYVGYGALMYVMSLFRCKPVDKREATPRVTLIIAAYNEEKGIRDKLENVLSLAYPDDRLEIMVGSDASTDQTDEIVASYADRGVILARVEGRKGKTEVQNQCAAMASGEVLVFTDATTVLEKNSLKEIVANFNDPSVGCVGARLVYRNRSETQLGEGGVSYWNYESNLKRIESSVSSLIGVSGCYYAVRKSLYTPIDPDLISDFVIALETVEKGYRVIYEDKALCEEETLDDVPDEFNMRIRVALRSYRALWEKRALLNPFRYGLFSIQLISHKVMRYLVGVVAIIVLAANLLLLDSQFYRAMLYFQLLCYLSAALSYLLFIRKGKKGLFSAPFYLVLVNAAATEALFKFIKGESVRVWVPKR